MMRRFPCPGDGAARERGIRSLMVEGGAAVITSFLKAELVDALVLTLSPKLVGGYKAVDELLGSGDRNSPALLRFIPVRPVMTLWSGGTFNTADTRHEVKQLWFTGPSLC